LLERRSNTLHGFYLHYGDELVSTVCRKTFVQGRGQRGSLKTLKLIKANDNVEFDYALAA
jgi:hypothetical protein